MKRVFLPYNEPMYSTYHWMSCAGIPAKQNPTSDNWYYNNTVNWRCTRRFLNGYTSPELNLGTGITLDLPFLNVLCVNMRLIRRCPIEIIKTMLDDGFYVVFHGVDDFYVEGKSWYKEHHSSHDGLIIGYDDEKEVFSIAAYDQRWIFTVFETPQQGFLEAISSTCSVGDYGELQAVKAKENEIVELDLEMIYNGLSNYLTADLSQYPMSCQDIVWGVPVYDFICLYFDKLDDGSIPYERRDNRIMRFIWEHKKCMLGRINAVEIKCRWNNNLSESYKRVVEKADKARFIYSKYSIKKSSSSLEGIQTILMEIKDEEVSILKNLCNKLKGYVDG